MKKSKGLIDTTTLLATALATPKQIYEFPNKSTMAGNDLFLISDTIAGNLTKNITATQLITNTLNPNILIGQGQVSGLSASLSAKLDLAGGTMTGDLILNADPTVALGAATKQYVDNASSSITILGTTDQVNVNLVGSTYTLSTPQNIAVTSTPTFGAMLFSGASLGGINSVVNMSGYGAGEYINLNSCSVLGLPNGYNTVPQAFWTCNLDYNTTANSFTYIRNGFGAGIVLSSNGSSLISSPTGIAGANAAPQICASWDFSQNFYVTKCNAHNTLVGTGGSGELNTNVSGFTPYFAAMGLGFTSGINPNAVLQLQGGKAFMPTSFTDTSESSFISGLGGTDASLLWYNSTDNLIAYWSGSTREQLLTISKINQGANMNITDDGHGNVTFASTGGGGTGTQINGSFACNTNTGLCTPTATPTALVVNPASFTIINSDGMTVTTAVVDGVTTAIIQNSSTGGARWCRVTFDVGVAPIGIGASNGQDYLFTIYVKKAGGSFVQYSSNRLDVPVSATNYVMPLSVSSEVQLDLNDLAFLRVSSSFSSPPQFRPFYFNGNLEDLTVASLPSTDALAQGSSNQYLSTDGGTTYENISGSLVPGNFTAGNTAGGQLIDSGVPVASFPRTVLITGTTQAMQINTSYIVKSSSPVTFTLPVSSAGIGYMKVEGTGSTTWTIETNVGQTVIANGLSGTTSITSGTAYDSVDISYGGDGSGQFNVQFMDGMEITLT